MGGHAEVLRRIGEAKNAAVADFLAGTVDLSYGGHSIGHGVYGRQIEKLTCEREHGALTECCLEHNQHVTESTRRRYADGVGSCPDCESRATILRNRAKEN